ncbi:MAG: response regulator [Bacteroidota bacterium]
MTLESNSIIKEEVFLQSDARGSSEGYVEKRRSASTTLSESNQSAAVSVAHTGVSTSERSNTEVNFLANSPTQEATSSTEAGSHDTMHEFFPSCDGPARVLVADDNLLVRVCLMNLLEQWGMNFHICSNGEEAWSALKESSFDLVLIDLQMPGLDGHEVVELLRASNKSDNQRIPVVALAGTDSQAAKARMFEAGANEFLSKPFCPEELNLTLNKHLKLSAHQQANLYVDLIDQEQINTLYEDDYEHMDYMFNLFVKNTSVSLSSIERAIDADDLIGLQREVHKVKPTFSMVGLKKVGQLAERIENQLEGVSQLSTVLKTDLRRFRSSVKEGVQLVIKKQQSISNYLK